MNDALEKLRIKLGGWLDDLILMLPNAVVAALALLGIVIAFRLGAAAAFRVLGRISHHDSLNRLVRRFLRLLGWLVGLAVALQILHLDKAVTTFLAGAGLVGLAVGFAFQDISANFIAGIFLAVKRPMDSGDFVQTNDVFGKVIAIELRSTVLQTMTGQIVNVPNRKIFEAPLTNFSKLGVRRVDVVVGVSYGDDLAKVVSTLQTTLESLDRVPDQPVEVFATGFGESSIDFVGRFWIPYKTEPDFLGSRSAAVIAIKRAFDLAAITIPFPIRTVDFSSVGGEQLASQLAAPDRRYDGV
ncbi:MAG: mechanosensitive ion channel family protein [Kofleriaceae bacterium]